MCLCVLWKGWNFSNFFWDSILNSLDRMEHQRYSTVTCLLNFWSLQVRNRRLCWHCRLFHQIQLCWVQMLLGRLMLTRWCDYLNEYIIPWINFASTLLSYLHAHDLVDDGHMMLPQISSDLVENNQALYSNLHTCNELAGCCICFQLFVVNRYVRISKNIYLFIFVCICRLVRGCCEVFVYIACILHHGFWWLYILSNVFSLDCLTSILALFVKIKVESYGR